MLVPETTECAQRTPVKSQPGVTPEIVLVTTDARESPRRSARISVIPSE